MSASSTINKSDSDKSLYLCVFNIMMSSSSLIMSNAYIKMS